MLSSAERRLDEGISGQSVGAATNGQVLDEVVFERLLNTMPVGRLKELYALCLSDTRTRVERMRVPHVVATVLS